MTAITLAGLRGQCRAVLASSTDWPDATLGIFIADSIWAYSNEWPRHLRHELVLTTGTQAYDLPGGHGFVRVSAVEYPAGNNPPNYLAQVDLHSQAFAVGGACYALRPVDDDVVADSDEVAGQLVFAQPVVTGQEAIVDYWGVHRIATTDTDVITVPETHLEALIAFVEFRAHWELETDEAYTQSSSAGSLLLSQLGENGRRAWNRWREVMQRLRPVNRATVPNPSWSEIGL